MSDELRDHAIESDERLLDRLAARDMPALDALYERHARHAFALAYRCVGDAETAEEVVQDAFVLLWRSARTFDATRGGARGWLLTIVRNRAIDAMRARESRPKAGTALDDVDGVLSAVSDTCAEAMRAIEARTIRDAVATLPAPQRATVEMAFFSDLSYPEIAARLGAPLGTVKSRLRLALLRLRVMLATPAATN